jgi:hypothetical protein
VARLSYGQLQTLWINNGGSKTLAPIMAAIALAESGGRTDALNDRAPDYSVGLWQINYYGSLLPGRTKAYGSPQQLMSDPNRQAKAAISILHGQGLGAWSTYTNGAYRKFLSGSSTAPLPSLPTTPADNVTGSSVQAAGAQQAGYDAVVDLTPWGMPINPFKWPGWIGGKLGDLAGGAENAVGGAMWDAIAPIVMASLGVAAGAGLVLLGVYVTTKPTVDQTRDDLKGAAMLAV